MKARLDLPPRGIASAIAQMEEADLALRQAIADGPDGDARRYRLTYTKRSVNAYMPTVPQISRAIGRDHTDHIRLMV